MVSLRVNSTSLDSALERLTLLGAKLSNPGTANMQKVAEDYVREVKERFDTEGDGTWAPRADAPKNPLHRIEMLSPIRGSKPVGELQDLGWQGLFNATEGMTFSKKSSMGRAGAAAPVPEGMGGDYNTGKFDDAKFWYTAKGFNEATGGSGNIQGIRRFAKRLGIPVRDLRAYKAEGITYQDLLQVAAKSVITGKRNHPILNETGTMRNSVRIGTVTDVSATVEVPYGGADRDPLVPLFHQFGTANMPARKIIDPRSSETGSRLRAERRAIMLLKSVINDVYTSGTGSGV